MSCPRKRKDSLPRKDLFSFCREHFVKQRSVDALASHIGLRLAHPLSFGACLLIPELTAAWRHDFGVGDRSISASFRGAAQDRFRIAAPDDSGSALKLGGALTFIGNRNFSVAAGVNEWWARINRKPRGCCSSSSDGERTWRAITKFKDLRFNVGRVVELGLSHLNF